MLYVKKSLFIIKRLHSPFMRIVQYARKMSIDREIFVLFF